MVKKYRKKPVVVEAIQWDGTNIEAIMAFIGESLDYFTCFKNAYTKDVELTIITSEHGVKANIGDYIIKGVQGELYTRKSDIFEATYELAEGENNA